MSKLKTVLMYTMTVPASFLITSGFVLLVIAAQFRHGNGRLLREHLGTGINQGIKAYAKDTKK